MSREQYSRVYLRHDFKVITYPLISLCSISMMMLCRSRTVVYVIFLKLVDNSSTMDT